MTERSRPMGKFTKVAELELADDTTVVLWRHVDTDKRLLLRYGNLFVVMARKGVTLHNSALSEDIQRWATRAVRYARKYKAKAPSEIGAMAFDNPDGVA